MFIGNVEIKGYAALAPMAGVADRAMREICTQYGCAFTVGELTSAKGVALGDKKSALLLDVADSFRPFASQIFGCEPETMAQAAKRAWEYGPDFLDINMGCPAPKVAVSGGGGSALMKDPVLAQKIVEQVVKAVEIPVTVKMRTGWDNQMLTAVELAKRCEQAGAAAITVHGRTRSQMFADPVDYETIALVKQAVNIPVIANGNITDGKSAAFMYEQTGCDFIMVGRGAMGRPWVFEQINAWLGHNVLLPDPPLSKRLLTMVDQIERMVKYKGEKIAFSEARKHAAWYMKGFRNAAGLRRMCAQISCIEDVFEVCKAAQELNWEEHIG